MNKRIKIDFASDIFDDERKKVWFLLPDGCKYISDLHYAIINEFDLQKKCKNGIKVLMDDHILLPNQSISILRDDDLLNVEKQIASKKKSKIKRDVVRSEPLTKRKRLKRKDSSSSSSSTSSISSSSSTSTSSTSSSSNSTPDASPTFLKASHLNITPVKILSSKEVPSSNTENNQNVDQTPITKTFNSEAPASSKKKKKRRKSSIRNNSFDNDVYYNESIVYVNKLNESNGNQANNNISEQNLESINYESLDDVNIFSLKKGDQIAFRMHEISSHMTPEIGPWRTSTVISYDNDFITLKLFDKLNLDEEFCFLSQFLIDENSDDTINLKKSDLLYIKRINT